MSIKVVKNLRIAQGDEQAFTEVYTSCSKELLAYIERLVQDKSVAQDIIQDTFTILWQKAHVK